MPRRFGAPAILGTTFHNALSLTTILSFVSTRQLFGQLLAGFSGSTDIDIDKLTSMLEENRDLLNDITSRECSKEQAAQLPKLLFDIVSQADERELAQRPDDDALAGPSSDDGEPVDCGAAGGGGGEAAVDAKPQVSSAQEIVRNLPKVWKVLTELLNHQEEKRVDLNVSTWLT